MIHCYTFDDLNIVLDSYSGSIHMVDPVAFDMIKQFENDSAENTIDAAVAKHGISREEAEECMADIIELKDKGKLYAEDSYEGIAKTYRRKNYTVKAICLHVAHTCNLNCSYCFASQGKYHGDRALMSFEVGKRALDFLVEHSGTRKNLEVDFFGGEPLMNFDVVKRLVAYARSIEEAAGKRLKPLLRQDLQGQIVQGIQQCEAPMIRTMETHMITFSRRRWINTGAMSFHGL